MDAWEKALAKFIEPWKKRVDVEGVLVAGSYVWGVPTKYSDIDVHIVLSDKVNWRERGNKVVDGFLVEYFANPPKQIKRYMQENYKSGKRTDAMMFSKGKILFDKRGEVKKLRQFANSEMKRKFIKLRGTELELAKYALWDHLDNLNDLADQKSPGFNLLYNLLLEKVIYTYARYAGVDVGSPAKLHKFFTSEKFRKAYGINAFPDKKFIKLLLVCLNQSGPGAFKAIEKLTLRVFKKTGGLKIDGWKVKTPLKLN